MIENPNSEIDSSSEPEGEDEKSQYERILKLARERFKNALEATREIREEAAEDRRFRAGDQWPEEIKAQRQADGRPCLTINKMPQFEQQVTNDQRQNRPAIKVLPVDDLADLETAKVYGGLIKNIEVVSNADTARDTAFENAVRGSYGFYRVVTEYASPDSFDLEIRTKRIRDPDSVLLDPNHQEPDGSDAEYGFVFERISKEQFLSIYGESKLKDKTEWDLEQSRHPDWVQNDSIQIAEYFYKEYKTVVLALLSDAQVMEKSKAEAYIAESSVQALDEFGNPMGPPTPQVQIVRTRKARIPSVKWCKFAGSERLEKTEWPGQWIPILPVYGAELVVDGKVIRESLIRHAKDPARMYNFWKSAETEAITLAPRSPYIAAEGQITENYKRDWATANTKNHSVLTFKPVALNGQPLPPPQRQVFEPAVQAITQASMLASDEVKATIGIYDGSLGARSNETSGIAIQRRNQQAQTSNFHFTDNLTRTIRHEGRIYVDLIPKVYDTARIARILGEDMEPKMVPVNKPFTDEQGRDRIHDLSLGKYDVTVDTGPSYATKRQESATFMQEMVKAYPPTMQLAGDLVVKSIDVPGATELAERFKKTLPPGLADDSKKQQAIPPQVKGQLESMSQMVEQLTGQVHTLQDEKEQKLLELESKERIEMKKLEVQVELKRAELDAQASAALLSAEIAEIKDRLSLLRVDQPIDDDFQGFAPESDGAMGAHVGPEAMNPTGGAAPGSSMEIEP